MKMNLKKISNEDALKTMLILATAALLFHLVFKIQYLDYVSVALMLTGLFIPPLAKIISALWLKLSEVLGAFSSKIILSILFFVVLTPLSFFYRLFNKDHLYLSKKNNPDD